MIQRKQPNQPILASDYNKLVDWINKPKIIGDSKSILVKNIAGNVIISSLNSASAGVNNSGDTYNGMFKVIQTANDKIGIVFGANETAYIAGRVQVNNYYVDVLKKEFTITETCQIIIEAETIGDPATSATAELKILDSSLYDFYYSYENGKGKVLVSHINFADGNITDFTQEHIQQFIPVFGGRL